MCTDETQGECRFFTLTLPRFLIEHPDSILVPDLVSSQIYPFWVTPKLKRLLAPRTYSSCKGGFNVPNNGTLAVTQVWDLLQAPDNLQFQVPTPLAYVNCIAFFFEGTSTPSAGLTNFQAAFDTGPIPIKREPSFVIYEYRVLYM